jgi:hypothetical protein
MNLMFVTSVAAALATLGAASPALAKLECYDFSGLTVGTEYGIGKTFNANHARIEFRPYRVGGNPSGGAVSGATVQQAQIAGGAAPEMEMKTLTVQILPNQPIQRMRVHLAQNITPTGGFCDSNFEVNGERHDGPSFASVDGKRLGGGEFRAKFASNTANWHVGTVELRAKPSGEITSFSIGGHTWRLDDMCIDR